MSQGGMAVRVITTGGTFAMREPNKADPGSEVIRSFNISWPCPIQVDDFVAVGSSRISFEMMVSLADRVEATLQQPDIAGVVVTHGTATLEETAYYLSLVVRSPKPVVVTGAIRRPSELSSDAQRNVRDSVVVASAPEARRLGTVVVMNSELHDPALVRKLNTNALDAFESTIAGPYGVVDSDRVTLWYHPSPPKKAPSKALSGSVQLIRTVVDQDDVLVKACVNARVDAIVVEGVGGGFIPPRMQSAFRDALENEIFVLLTPRCGSGPFNRQEAFEASLSPTARQHLLYSAIGGHKERLKLMALLSHTRDPARLAEWFAT